MITLTKAFKLADDYDDEIVINPDHIKTMVRVAIGESDDDVVLATQIDIGTIGQRDDGSIISVPLMVMEPMDYIITASKAWVRK